jgi:hypothetical protein
MRSWNLVPLAAALLMSATTYAAPASAELSQPDSSLHESQAQANECAGYICLGDTVQIIGQYGQYYRVVAVDSQGQVWIQDGYGQQLQMHYSQLQKIGGGYPNPNPNPYPGTACIGSICVGDLVQLRGNPYETFQVMRIRTQAMLEIVGPNGTLVARYVDLIKVGSGGGYPNPNPGPQNGQCIANICIGDTVQVLGASGNVIDIVVTIYSNGNVLVRDPYNGNTAVFHYTRLRKLY